MSVYKNEIHASKLFKRFDNLVGIDGVTAPEVDQLRANVLDIAEYVGPKMAEIGKTFHQYTDHSLTHLCNIANLIHSFLPESKSDDKGSIGLNALELTMLWAGILLHDVGMFVSETEKEDELKSDAFRRFRQRNKDRVDAAARANQANQPRRAQAIEDALIAEYYRRNHAQRSNSHITNHLASEFVFREVEFADWVGKVAESHNWRVFQRDAGLSNDPYVAQLETDRMIGNVPVNLQYLACCLRMGDILDFDRSRTPLVVFEHMDFTEHISMVEWNKHRSITGWKVGKAELLYQAECERPEYYVAVQEFLSWVDDELENFSRIVEGFKESVAQRYPMPLPHRVKRDRVRMKNPRHITGAFKYQLEFEEIMQLLMDKSLYPDPALFLRELLQNSLDACRYQQALAKKARMADKYHPRIDIWDYSHDKADPRIVFRDNGIGMDLRTIEQYFLRVGKSYYRSPDFIVEREQLAAQGIYLDSCSRFGIGFLSCFLAGGFIEVETYRLNAQPLKVSITGPSRYFLIEHLAPKSGAIPFLSPANRLEDGPPNYSGTKVTVHLKAGWREGFKETENGVVFDTIATYAVATEFPITIHQPLDGTSSEISGDAFLRATFPKGYHDSRYDKVRHPLEDLLTLIKIPLPEGDDALKFNGSLWVVMFDDGTPYGGRQRNGLSISIDGGYRAEPDGYICINFESNLLSAIELFLKLLDKVSAKDKLDSAFDYPSYPSHLIPEFVAIWNQLEDSEKLLVKSMLDSFETEAEPNRFDLEVFVKAMLEADRAEIIRQALLRRVLNDTYIETFYIENPKLALHGILVPSGILNWEPLKGHALQDSLLPAEVFATLNLYGDGTPVPSASRLYISPENAHKMKQQLNASCLQWAIEGMNAHAGDADWELFFGRILAFYLDASPEAILQKIEHLADKIRMRFHADISDENEEVSMEPEADSETENYLQELKVLMKNLGSSFLHRSSKEILLQFLGQKNQLPKWQYQVIFKELGALLSNSLDEKNEPSLFGKLKGMLDFLVQIAELDESQSKISIEEDPKDPTLREAILAHQGLLPVRPSNEYWEPTRNECCEDLAIFHEAPLIKGENEQPYRDLRGWVKKYLPSIQLS